MQCLKTTPLCEVRALIKGSKGVLPMVIWPSLDWEKLREYSNYQFVVTGVTIDDLGAAEKQLLLLGKD